MSGGEEIDVNCPDCGSEVKVTIFRNLQLDYPEHRALIFEDRANMATCGQCGSTGMIPVSLAATNSNVPFSVWFEPFPDDSITEYLAMHEKSLGPGNYRTSAMRIADWGEFKATIEK